MRRTNRCLLVSALSIFLPIITLANTGFVSAAEEPLNVVVTIPVLKDFAQQIGGAHVQVTSLLKGYENEHTYSPKPSDLVAVRKARLLFEIGIGLEVWVSSLVKNAGSSTLQVVTTSSGIPLMNDGHVGDSSPRHEDGVNPHIWLDPENAARMIRHMADALIRADPPHAGDYERNTVAYLNRLDQVRAELDERVRDLNERRFIAHHPAWPYLARRFGFEIAGTIQLQSGSEPSARHVQHIVELMRKGKIKVVVSEVQLNQRFPGLLAKETGCRVVVLTTLPGGLPGTETYLDMLRYNVVQLVAALKES